MHADTGGKGIGHSPSPAGQRWESVDGADLIQLVAQGSHFLRPPVSSEAQGKQVHASIGRHRFPHDSKRMEPWMALKDKCTSLKDGAISYRPLRASKPSLPGLKPPKPPAFATGIGTVGRLLIAHNGLCATSCTPFRKDPTPGGVSSDQWRARVRAGRTSTGCLRAGLKGPITQSFPTDPDGCGNRSPGAAA